MSSGFIRVKLLQCERARPESLPADETFDPFVAVNVKEAQSVPGERATPNVPQPTAAFLSSDCF